MIFIEYPKCTTCIRAKRFLDEINVDYIDRNIKEDNPKLEELKEWHKKSGVELKKMFNTSGLLYKEYNLKEKLNSMTDEEKFDLLSTNGMLVKRPILITEKTVLFGFKEEEWKKVLK